MLLSPESEAFRAELARVATGRISRLCCFTLYKRPPPPPADEGEDLHGPTQDPRPSTSFVMSHKCQVVLQRKVPPTPGFSLEAFTSSKLGLLWSGGDRTGRTLSIPHFLLRYSSCHEFSHYSEVLAESCSSVPMPTAG